MHAVIFAHGLDSSPGGTKASYLRERFGTVTPPLRDLGLAAQADTLAALAHQHQPCILVGSSLGGLAALGAAVRVPTGHIAHLVLLAPAVSAWRNKGAFQAAEQTRPGLLAEALRMEQLSIPETIAATLIHGIEDDVVCADDVIALAVRSRSSRLVLIHDDHRLAQSKALILSVIGAVASGQDPLASDIQTAATGR
ncbi:MAG: YqiA/YcfP family alpha/beta fold hydrolase [Myxococcota bacterium]|nr:YqiA/YcfP family alpha/beta fold hydrolase [Myxococcota bacterium]